jgi:hypothetical protein
MSVFRQPPRTRQQIDRYIGLLRRLCGQTGRGKQGEASLEKKGFNDHEKLATGIHAV